MKRHHNKRACKEWLLIEIDNNRYDAMRWLQLQPSKYRFYMNSPREYYLENTEDALAFSLVWKKYK